jgi:hypothetical protein
MAHLVQPLLSQVPVFMGGEPVRRKKPVQRKKKEAPEPDNVRAKGVGEGDDGVSDTLESLAKVSNTQKGQTPKHRVPELELTRLSGTLTATSRPMFACTSATASQGYRRRRGDRRHRRRAWRYRRSGQP